MNTKNILLDSIFAMDDIQQINKVVGLSKVLLTLDNPPLLDAVELVEGLENNVCFGLPLKVCYELYYKYKHYSLNFIIIYRERNGRITKIPLVDLRQSIRELYVAIVEIVLKSGVIESDFGIQESGDTSYKIGGKE